MARLAGMAVIYPFMRLGWVPFKFGLEVLWLGVEAHGWERSPSRSWVPIVEAPGYHRHPASTYM